VFLLFVLLLVSVFFVLHHTAFVVNEGAVAAVSVLLVVLVNVGGGVVGVV
jgi:hypothetical protein